MRFLFLLATCIVTVLSTSPADALLPNRVKGLFGQSFSSDDEATNFFLRHYNAGCEAYGEDKWELAATQFQKVINAFPNTPCTALAYFYFGASLYHLGDYDLSNEAFSNYLKCASSPDYFEEAILFKFQIAEAFRCGCKKRFVNFRCCPKCISASSLALTIYDEVIMAMPSHPIAADALYSKGYLLMSTGDYKGSIEEFQSYVRRFPKNERTPDAYIMISRNYYLQSKTEFQNPDLLALAAINARRFREVFPKEERLAEADAYVVAIEELYARGLCSVGAFYERNCKPFAAALYYRSAIVQFPNTQAAEYSRCRLAMLGYDQEMIPDCSESTHMKKELEILDAPPDDVDAEESAEGVS